MAGDEGDAAKPRGSHVFDFLDETTHTLFAYLEIEDEALWAKSADTEICRKWWDYMKDIMRTNPDNSPESRELTEVFHLEPESGKGRV